jgi:phosphate transport system substrate-binding protein
MNVLKLSAAALVASVAFAGAAVARDQIQIAGSSTVLPYASIVAEAFGENTDFGTPVVESGGSGAGRKKLCEGVGENTIDIANSSSRIKQSDIDTCAANGVKEIQEVRIGYDGIVFASDINGPEYAFTPADWHSALAAKIVKDGKLIDNPNKAWNEVRADLPAQPILALDRKSTRLNSSHRLTSRMPSSA